MRTFGSLGGPPDEVHPGSNVPRTRLAIQSTRADSTRRSVTSYMAQFPQEVSLIVDAGAAWHNAKRDDSEPSVGGRMQCCSARARQLARPGIPGRMLVGPRPSE